MKENKNNIPEEKEDVFKKIKNWQEDLDKFLLALEKLKNEL